MGPRARCCPLGCRNGDGAAATNDCCEAVERRPRSGSHRPLVEAWHGQTIEKPSSEQREYLQIVRAILRGEQPPQDTVKFRSQFALIPGLVQPELPIYISALSPRMLEIAGEIADGVILWLCNPRYISEVVLPSLAIGRERAGLTLEGFDIVAAVPSALIGDDAGARTQMRSELILYLSLPFYRAMLERSGFDEMLAEYDDAAASGDSDGMMAAITDEFLDAQWAVGDGR